MFYNDDTKLHSSNKHANVIIKSKTKSDYFQILVESARSSQE